MEEYHDFVVELVRAAAVRVKQAHTEVLQISNKNNDPRDFVTSVDLETHEFLKKKILEAYPTHRVHSEEGDATEMALQGYEWILDPIDGTSNFMRHIPHFAVCAVLINDGVPVAGAVYNPITDELFSFSGSSAYFNGTPVSVSSVTEPKNVQSIFVVGHQAPLWDWGAALYRSFLEHLSKNKSLGSAALDLCYLAAGRADVVVYGTYSMPDGIVGVAMVRAAGGEVYSVKTGEPIGMRGGRQTIVATPNRELYEKMRPHLHAELLP